MVCIDPHQTGIVGEGSDHLQLIKFWPSRTPGKRVWWGENFWLRQQTVFASLWFDICIWLVCDVERQDGV